MLTEADCCGPDWSEELFDFRSEPGEGDGQDVDPRQGIVHGDPGRVRPAGQLQAASSWQAATVAVSASADTRQARGEDEGTVTL
ncbi:hypothetical protein [Streptomyces sp. NPDC054863]